VHLFCNNVMNDSISDETEHSGVHSPQLEHQGAMPMWHGIVIV
jgi:hypothetical protein